MDNSTPVTRALEALDIPYRFFRHPGQVYSLEQAAQERGQRPEQIVRSIVFRLRSSLSLPESSRGQISRFVMVLVAGPKQVHWPTLRSYLGQSQLTMASEPEVLAATGYPLGAVSPFGLPEPMRILVDESVFEEREVSIGSGVRYTTVILRREDLRRALGEVEVGCFTA
jgi:prolyl-tRNA editing enzyme YbaK/EbsC (Cys-tRNA(Pro) deacylase)